MTKTTITPNQTPPNIARELVTVANILGSSEVEGASNVAKVSHSYKLLAALPAEPELTVTKFLKYKIFAPAVDIINTELAAKLGISKEELGNTLAGNDAAKLAEINRVLNSEEFSKKLAPQLDKALNGAQAVINQGVERGFFADDKGKQYGTDFCAIRDAHKSLDGDCPKGCPVAAANQIYSKPASTQVVVTR